LPRRAANRLYEWMRHHISSLIGTGVDFVAMIGMVELAGASPVTGTVVGAAMGGVTNFWLGRYFTFRSNANPVSGQFFRYGLVSLMSLALNALGEHLFISQFSSRYVLGRVLVAATVNNAWNYPMQRFFVFAERKPAKEDAS
jgi:putative flippase GtrA